MCFISRIERLCLDKLEAHERKQPELTRDQDISSRESRVFCFSSTCAPFLSLGNNLRKRGRDRMLGLRLGLTVKLQQYRLDTHLINLIEHTSPPCWMVGPMSCVGLGTTACKLVLHEGCFYSQIITYC